VTRRTFLLIYIIKNNDCCQEINPKCPVHKSKGNFFTRYVL